MRAFETYKHYKGGLYVKLGEALHSETDEVMVVYVCVVRGWMFVRPKSLWDEKVMVDGQEVPRFTPLPNGLTKEQAKKVTWSL